MKTQLVSLALLLSASSAFADSTQFLPRRSSTPVATPQRESNRHAPYSRSNPRIQTPPTTTPRVDSSIKSVDHPQPYSRSNPRSHRSNA